MIWLIRTGIRDFLRLSWWQRTGPLQEKFGYSFSWRRNDPLGLVLAVSWAFRGKSVSDADDCRTSRTPPVLHIGGTLGSCPTSLIMV
jgi:hypothetical protein